MKVTKVNKFGFTAIELFIVILIVSILITVGVVDFRIAKNRIKQNVAQTTIKNVRAKLGEYYAENGSYPANKTAVYAYLADLTKGNSPQLAKDFGDGTTGDSSNIRYTPSPLKCDNSVVLCKAYIVVANKSIWGGSTDETVTN